MNRLVCTSRCHFKSLINSYGISSPLLAPKKSLQQNVFFRGVHDQKSKIRSTLNYMVAMGVMTVGLSYAAVPLYRIFCQSRPLKIRFNADTASSMQWNFKPQQRDITVDMPVFFYIDPEFVDDPKMEYVDEIVLSYTFFEAKEGMKLPVPTYVRK
ncbi:Cytochrome c oxidase assembly protein cox11 [Operophtera brumata]|uniref:Cytochrome c oxidase assembly protein cox11 n=1 Tax=Operophtera brumata TaxID=104452 RepID=A0A0L7KZ01_OPEBR|nr:Cytochrome c oxidase assembly protein cox11 [Operophtera brumata]